MVVKEMAHCWDWILHPADSVDACIYTTFIDLWNPQAFEWPRHPIEC